MGFDSGNEGRVTVVEQQPRLLPPMLAESGPRRSVGFPLALAFAAGGLASLHVFFVGRLATAVGSAELAASGAYLVAGASLFAVAVMMRAPGRALRRVQAGARVRWWQLAAGINGGFVIIVTGAVAPKVGVALFTVAAVCGQALGSLIVDRLGLSPAGRRHFTAPRLVGVALALVAVAIGVSGGPDQGLHLGGLGLVLLSSAGVAVQQAAMGHVASATGEPLIAAWINASVGLAAVLAAWVVATSGTAPDGWSAPAAEWLIPGLSVAATMFLIAKVVARLGVLRMMLAIIAGQSVAALTLDGFAPIAGETITLRATASVVLTLAAVAVSGLGSRRLATGA